MAVEEVWDRVLEHQVVVVLVVPEELRVLADMEQVVPVPEVAVMVLIMVYLEAVEAVCLSLEFRGPRVVYP